MAVALGRAPSFRAAAKAGREHEQDGERRRDRRSVELQDESARRRHMKPKTSDELRSRRPVGIDERVVVALEHVAAVVNRDDPVKDDPVDQPAPVADHIAHAIRVLWA